MDFLYKRRPNQQRTFEGDTLQLEMEKKMCTSEMHTDDRSFQMKVDVYPSEMKIEILSQASNSHSAKGSKSSRTSKKTVTSQRTPPLTEEQVARQVRGRRRRHGRGSGRHKRGRVFG